MNLAAIILAAGKGSRMRSSTPKVLHKIAGLPLLGHVLNLTESMRVNETRVVVGYESGQIEDYLKNRGSDAVCVRQARQLGTGDAVKCTKESLKDFDGHLMILCGDVPFINKRSVLEMSKKISAGADIVILGFESSEPKNYGRIIINNKNQIEGVIEEKDANLAQKELTLCNSGIYYGKKSIIFSLLEEVRSDNAQLEFYLTDIIKLGSQRGLKIELCECGSNETLGINCRADLATGERIFQAKLRSRFLDKGVTLIDPNTNHFSYDTQIEADTIIHPNVIIGPGVKIGRSTEIFSFSHLEGCTVKTNSRLGPFARIRPHTTIGKSVKIGNFVEVKNAIFESESKANHLSYIGDAKIGPKTNIGAGTIFCNYDGVSKHQTEIGTKTFIGSNSSLVAPLKIGSNAFIGSGSTVTKNVPENALVLGRQRQTTKPGLGKKIMDKLRNAKKQKKD